MVSRMRRLPVVVSLLLVITALGSVSTATAAPAPLGQVQNLQADATSAAGGRYRVAATWGALARATSYAVKLAVNGVVVSSTRTTEPAWSDTVAAVAGASARVTVTPFADKRRGKPRSVTISLPDVKAPTGSFALNTVDGTATVTQGEIGDDVTPDAEIQRYVDWGQGAGFVPFADGLEDTHTYTETGRYPVQVKLVDAAGNARILALGAAVVGDVSSPDGEFSLSTATAWAKWTRVRLVEGSASDDMSPAEVVLRSVDWGDGSPEQVWRGTAVRDHVYAAGGAYKVTVTLEDEAGNEADHELDVTVTADTVDPVLTWRVPKRKPRSLRSWRYIRGSAQDGQTDVAFVRVKMVQRRDGRWVTYRSGRWVRAAGKKAALRAATARRVTVSDLDLWRVRAPGLRRGVLVYRAWARDAVGNVGPQVTRSQRLTRR